MDSHLGHPAGYRPSHAPDRHPVFSFGTLNQTNQPVYASSGLTAEPTAYLSSQTLPSLGSQKFTSPGENSSSGSRYYSSQPSFMSPPTTTPASYPIYHAPSIPDYQGPIPTYGGPPQSYSSSGPYASSTTTMQAYPSYHPVVPGTRFPDLRPMPAGGLNETPLSSPHQPRASVSSTRRTNGESQPTHVVGLQGRRGILPRAAGRPAVVPGESATGHKSANTPGKDADGKYPCPNCDKTYLHAKHLKRHLLRHSGIRPYSCGLCKDTFSRSDILKRHFQKCSVRRGNPTGENHLTHTRATKKSMMEAAGKLPREDNVVPGRTRPLPSTPTTDVGHYAMNKLPAPFDFNALGLDSPGYAEEKRPWSNRESRSSSVKRPSTSCGGPNLGNFSGSSSSSYDATGFGYSGQITPDSITTSGAATPYPYSHELRSNQFPPDASYTPGAPGPEAPGGNKAALVPSGMGASLPHIIGSSHGRANDLDWSAYFTAPEPDEYPPQQLQHTHDNALQPIKSEHHLPHASLSLSHDYSSYLPTKV